MLDLCFCPQRYELTCGRCVREGSTIGCTADRTTWELDMVIAGERFQAHITRAVAVSERERGKVERE